MSIVTSDFGGKIKWAHIMNYNPIEYFSFLVSASGIIISVVLGYQGLQNWIRNRRNRKKWIQETILSATKKK